MLGGYLRHGILPIARQAFYAGLVDYYAMEKLIELYEEVKWYLRTNGQGWARPIKNCKYIKQWGNSCCNEVHKWDAV